MAKRVLITGASGFLGSSVAQLLNANGFEVFGLYRSSARHVKHLSDIEWHHVDISSPIELALNFDAIIHLASDIPGNGSTPEEMYLSNCVGTENVLAYADRSGVQTLVYASSMSVYGRPSEPFLSESSPVLPDNSYGETKARAEQLVEKWGLTSERRRFLILRLPAVVGLGSHHNFPSDLLSLFAQGKEVKLFNPNNLYNHVILASEVSSFINHYLSDSTLGSSTINLATEQPITISTLASIFKKRIGSQSRVSLSESIQSIPIIDCSKAKLLGFSPLHVEETILKYLSDYGYDVQRP